MAKQTVCDLCGSVLENGENMAGRSPTFVYGAYRVTTSVKIDGIHDPDLCIDCLRHVVAEGKL